jgi:hypothetical protein
LNRVLESFMHARPVGDLYHGSMRESAVGEKLWLITMYTTLGLVLVPELHCFLGCIWALLIVA